MSPNSVIYAVRHLDEANPEILYIGSTKNKHRRFDKEHRNPKYKGHADFGKWLHSGNLAKVRFDILETIEGLRGKKLTHELLRKEFLWKRKLAPQKFGKLDGLSRQPLEVRRAVRKERASRYVRKPRNSSWKSEIYATNVDHERIDKVNEYQRQYHKLKNIDNKNFKPRGQRKRIPYTEARAKKLEKRRERHRKKLEAAGKTYKPRTSRIQRQQKLIANNT